MDGSEIMLSSIIQFLKNTDELTTGKMLVDTFAKYASNATEYDNIAKWYMDMKDYPMAIKYAEKTLVNVSSNEAMQACRANLSKLYNHINDPVSSLRYSSINLKLNPDNHDALMEQVFSYFLLNQKDKSEAILRELIQLPNLPDELIHRIKFNLGTYDLYKGRFQEGLRGFLLDGKKLGLWKNLTLPFKFWEGGIQPGKTILIVAEGGIGDEIINVRFTKHLEELGMIPIWYTTRRELVPIFTRQGVNVVTTLDKCPTDALWTYAMSLPIYLDLQPKDLWHGSYITPSAEYVNKWKQLLHTDSKKLKVGIRWTGNPLYEHDLHRSVPLDAIYDVVIDRDFELYSLQRDTGADDVKLYPDIIDLQDKLETFEDALGALSQMDIVITSCTSIAHASAALDIGKTIILAPISAYYTWASTTDTSTIWYSNNTKIVRQTKHACWNEPMNQLAEILDNLTK